MPLSKDKIASLWEVAGARQTSTGVGTQRRKRLVWMNAEGELLRGKPPTELIGEFTGNVGSVRRSRKGAMRIAPNGSRRYTQDWDNTIKFYRV